jgi:hypothetical protein
VPEVGELLEVLRPLEHQVLEEVGEAGPPLRLRSDADVIDDRHADDRRGAVWGQHHPQAIGQGEPLDGIL